MIGGDGDGSGKTARHNQANHRPSSCSLATNEKQVTGSSRGFFFFFSLSAFLFDLKTGQFQSDFIILNETKPKEY